MEPSSDLPMDLPVIIRLEDSYVHLEVLKDLELSFTFEMFSKALRLAKDHHLKKLLFDISNVSTKDSSFEQYKFAKQLPATGLLRSMPVAVFYGEKEEHLFVETVARNQGFNFRFFNKESEATEWILNA